MLRKLAPIVIAFVLVLVPYGVLRQRAHAQQVDESGKGAKPKPPPDQKFNIVPDISPSSLEEELKKLNKAGYRIEKSNLLVVDGKITIFLQDSDLAANQDEDDEE